MDHDLPRNYHSALISHLRNEIKKYPDGYITSESKQRVCITYDPQDQSIDAIHRHRYTTESPQGSKMIPLIRKRQQITSELFRLEDKWARLYKDPVPDCPPIYYTGIYDSTHYESLIPCNNPYPNIITNVYNSVIYRSKNEVITAQVLDSLGLEFKYETTLQLLRSLHPDFAVLSRALNRCFYLEIIGGMDMAEYAENAGKKIGEYVHCGIRPGRDVIFYHTTGRSEIDVDVLISQIMGLLELEAASLIT